MRTHPPPASRRGPPPLVSDGGEPPAGGRAAWGGGKSRGGPARGRGATRSHSACHDGRAPGVLSGGLCFVYFCAAAAAGVAAGEGGAAAAGRSVPPPRVARWRRRRGRRPRRSAPSNDGAAAPRQAAWGCVRVHREGVRGSPTDVALRGCLTDGCTTGARGLGGPPVDAAPSRRQTAGGGALSTGWVGPRGRAGGPPRSGSPVGGLGVAPPPGAPRGQLLPRGATGTARQGATVDPPLASRRVLWSEPRHGGQGSRTACRTHPHGMAILAGAARGEVARGASASTRHVAGTAEPARLPKSPPPRGVDSPAVPTPHAEGVMWLYGPHWGGGWAASNTTCRRRGQRPGRPGRARANGGHPGTSSARSPPGRPTGGAGVAATGHPTPAPSPIRPFQRPKKRPLSRRTVLLPCACHAHPQGGRRGQHHAGRATATACTYRIPARTASRSPPAGAGCGGARATVAIPRRWGGAVGRAQARGNFHFIADRPWPSCGDVNRWRGGGGGRGWIRGAGESPRPTGGCGDAGGIREGFRWVGAPPAPRCEERKVAVGR